MSIQGELTINFTLCSMQLSKSMPHCVCKLQRFPFLTSGSRHDVVIKGATSRFAHLEKFSLNFSNSSFVIRVNLLRP